MKCLINQVYGVCCPNPAKAETAGGSGSVIPTVPINPDTGLPYPDFPWWQYFPYIPQYQTPSTTAAPETSSQWWVPEVTTSKPTTTSPWWVPEVTSPTKPWWVPQVTTPTSPPWWAQPSQPTTTTTTTMTTPAPQSPEVGGSQEGPTTKTECGKGPRKILSFTDDESRIVGGVEARKNSWPFQVRSKKMKFLNEKL